MAVSDTDAVCQYDQYDYQAEFWTGRDYEHQVEHHLVQQLCQRYVAGETLLDVGCGFGRLFPAYSASANQFYLVDYSQSMLDQAQQAIQSDRVTFQQASVYELPTHWPQMDAVIMMRVLHHTPNLDAVFSELNRVLRPGGVLILEIPNQKHWLNRLRFRLGRMAHNPHDTTPMALGRLFYNYLPEHVFAVMDRHGFSIEHRVSHSFFRNPWLKRWVSARRLAALDRGVQGLLGGYLIAPSLYVVARKTPC